MFVCVFCVVLGCYVVFLHQSREIGLEDRLRNDLCRAGRKNPAQLSKLERTK